MKTTLEELLVVNCEHILRLNHLVATHSSNLILYPKKAMRTIRICEACETRPLVRYCNFFVNLKYHLRLSALFLARCGSRILFRTAESNQGLIVIGFSFQEYDVSLSFRKKK